MAQVGRITNKAKTNAKAVREKSIILSMMFLISFLSVCEISPETAYPSFPQSASNTQDSRTSSSQHKQFPARTIRENGDHTFRTASLRLARLGAHR